MVDRVGAGQALEPGFPDSRPVACLGYAVGSLGVGPDPGVDDTRFRGAPPGRTQIVAAGSISAGCGCGRRSGDAAGTPVPLGSAPCSGRRGSARTRARDARGNPDPMTPAFAQPAPSHLPMGSGNDSIHTPAPCSTTCTRANSMSWREREREPMTPTAAKASLAHGRQAIGQWP